MSKASNHLSPQSARELLPKPPITRWLNPIQRFLHVEAASGVVLLVCTAIALILANSPFAKAFAAIWKTPVVISIGGLSLSDTVGHLIINDGLMTIFFFVVGLEIKREIVAGELADPRKARLPIIAAIGGMVAPALVYLTFQWGGEGQQGWAIPMATDIAFVVGLLALFGRRVPFGLKLTLLALAIVDDLGAVLIIAFVFTEQLALGWLGLAAAAFACIYVLNKVGVRAASVYLLLGALIWLAFLKAGIHPTVAGVLLGFMTPATAWVKDEVLEAILNESSERSADVLDAEPAKRLALLEPLQFAAREAAPPLHRYETLLHPWVAFAIMPLFALANAGVALEPAGLVDPVAQAVAAGLLIGKPLGILVACGIAVRLGLTELPSGVTWRIFAGGACLAGIGFTMALFLNTLAFPAESHAAQQAAGKIGTLVGSLLSAVVGSILLLTAGEGRQQTAASS